MKFDVEQFKSNRKFLFVMAAIVLVLVLINGAISNVRIARGQLEDSDIEIKHLVINEIMTSNKGVFNDPEGNSYDWVELYNGSSKEIDLTNFGLSDKEDGEIKWLFPSVKIPSNSYLVIYLTGDNMKGLYANFSLKSEGGELLTLKNSSGKVVDAIRTVYTEKNCSMARNSSGEWITTESITPGYPNNEEGKREFQSSSKALEVASPLALTEFLPSNEGNVIFNDDKLYSYIEVTNEGDEVINLNDYYISNDTKTPFKWRLPDYNLEAGKSYLIYTNELDHDNNASFELKHKNGTVILATKNKIVEQVTYEQLTKGVAYIKSDNKWHQGNNISPGYPNNTSGLVSFASEVDRRPGRVVINEVMSSNDTYLGQNGGQFYDWIELYNDSGNSVNLSEYSLTTDKDDKKMYQLPDVTLNPGQYYIFMASGDTSLTNSSYYHTNFKLSSAKAVLLYKDNTLEDSLFIYAVPRKNSYGRGSNGGHFYYSNPTPGYTNDANGIREISYSPTFSKEGGVYNNVSQLEISIEGSGDIYYTTDGSVPNTNSTIYQNPIKIDKTTVIRAVAYESNKKNSDVITNSYIINENHTIPVISVSLPDSSFNRINNNAYGHETVSAHVEFYEEDNSFSVDCGFKLFGGQSRELAKKSYQVKINSEYSGTSLHYKVFPNKDLVEFNTLVLRSGSQDMVSSMMRDEVTSTMLVNYSELLAQAARPTILYINGKYWGVYFIREKIDEDFVENNYNVKGGNTNIANIAYSVSAGSATPFRNITNYVANHDMTDSANYEYIKQVIDIEDYVDMIVTQWIACNTDVHNIRYYNNQNVDGGKMKGLVYDMDYGFRSNYGSYYLNYIQNPTTIKAVFDTSLLPGLMRNSEFRQEMVKRVAYNYKYVWTEEHINETFNYFYNSIQPEMERNCSRWGLDYNNWEREAAKLKTNMLNRHNNIVNEAKNYFKLSQDEVNEYFY